jgi:hypothetical protein
VSFLETFGNVSCDDQRIEVYTESIVVEYYATIKIDSSSKLISNDLPGDDSPPELNVPLIL